MNVLILKVDGIHCGSCIGRIERCLESTGAKKVQFDLTDKTVKVFHQENNYQKFIDSVNNLGYTASYKVDYDEDGIL